MTGNSMNYTVSYTTMVNSHHSWLFLPLIMSSETTKPMLRSYQLSPLTGKAQEWLYKETSSAQLELSEVATNSEEKK